MINVTKPFLPPLEEYKKLIDEIWERNWLTNNGPLVNDLELKLKEYLDVNHLLFLSNGTIALQIAIKALDLKGDIITTPFSYVATTSSIVWEGCNPVFVDIDTNTLNIDPSKIEAAITEKTTAILATHVFGNPCDIEAIDAVAKKYGLKVIYDGAHAFGVIYNGKSIFEYGDISTSSFHATKLFHTIEGGAVITKDKELLRKMALLRNFGHKGYDFFEGIGINGKNSEFHAAMGICNLRYVEGIMVSRKKQWSTYVSLLKNLNVETIKITTGTDRYNYSYFPIILKNEEILLQSVKALQEQYVNPRRYFYPSLSELDYVKAQICPISESISKRVLCLPMFEGLVHEQEMIARVLLRVQNN